MQLVRNDPDFAYFVRRCEPDAITVGDRRLTTSFAVAPDRLLEAWPATDAANLDSAAIDALIGLAPEVVLLGTGARQRFPSPAVQAAFLTRGIGFEVMDNAAAARTYNVLAGEGRKVVAAFVLGNLAPP
jgi:uncharacterized protein